MEKRRDSLSALKLCRFCLSQDGSLTSLYDRSLTPKNSVNLPLKILSCISVEVFPSDKMPCYICKRCKYFMELCYDYKQMCRQADETILQYVQSGTAVESIVWPPSLVKCFRENAKSQPPEPKVIKTEGGATIQVTSQEVSDSDDDIAGVFNLKIEDAPKRAKSNTACIKVVSKGDDLEITKEKPKPKKGFPSVTKLARHVRTHAGDRPYPCKYCNKSFMKSQHYTRHVRLKHRETIRSARGPFGQGDPYQCEQCEDCFATQDELIYHSAIHATQNLICPLCQEKFDSVDAVTAHIKTHVNGTEFMCELCELVFTSQEKLEIHVVTVHEEELHAEQDEQGESSMDMDPEEDDDNDIQVKEEDDHMVVEIKKPNNYMLPADDAAEIKAINATVSEESESEVTLTAMQSLIAKNKNEPETPGKTDLTHEKTSSNAETLTEFKPTASILRKAEEMKRKRSEVIQISQNSTPAKSDKPNKPENSNGSGASEKSLRLLEKELQDLKRTSSKEPTKTSAKPMESLKSRKPQIQTSTPKAKPAEEKRPVTKSPVVDKKLPQRRTIMTKENKEPKEKEVKSNNNTIKEDKEVKTVVKNGVTEKSLSEDGVRRSTRPSKIKDYARLIQDRSQVSEEEEDGTDDDEEYKEPEKTPENRKSRRFSIKALPKTVPASPAPIAPSTPTAPTPSVSRKRGRPRKEIAKPTKLKKAETDDEESELIENEEKLEQQPKPQNAAENMPDLSPPKVSPEQNPSSVLMSPSGQTLKKVPIKALPPGVRPLPLPTNSRPMTGELCEMQIGKKVVKVQKIVMTKAEVEAMAKKGLVEMKDGTMVLKQGIKLPTNDPLSIKSTLFGDENKLSAAVPKNSHKPSDLPRIDFEN